MKRTIAALALTLAAAPALADDDIINVEATGSVAEVADRLVASIEGAGATVFARVDHAAGARGAGMELAPMELVIFGNPKLGTPAIQTSPMAGLVLPMKVLVWQDAEGVVTLSYQDPEEMLDEVGVDDDLEAIGQMEGALKKLTGAAAGG
ncbi:DUF302 domain-containing protein [Vannielia litorea]|uniref:Uncharacterized conserved protein, DUF302 family n=1 Tax=Vannielia litorea TaxID=1217970 RepID=A0A1N6G317_9RHOB|nr:DUF302 domain-containing protein [Vannielia litorea]SIO01890.1 Uncharacterized conserved protein, DUF302 family [Vannielia litorea]